MKPRVHLFCPAFMDTFGVIEFDDIQFSEVISTLKDPSFETVWRSSWTGVRDMLNRHGSFSLAAEGQRREVISSNHSMKVGDLGILFRTTEKLDLKSSQLTPQDFVFTLCRRIK